MRAARRRDRRVTKGLGLRTKIAIAGVLWALLLAGCETVGPGTGTEVPKDGVLLTVDFESGRTLRYKFVSYRDIALDWDPNAASGAGKVQNQSERVEMVVAYTPQVVDPLGVSTIRAECESVRVERVGRPSGRGINSDAVQRAQGKAFALKVDPRGKIVDASELEALIKELGDAAFRKNARGGRIKEPDLVGDFIASQWFLWDAVASVENPAAGVTAGQSWRSQLWVPTPMVMRKARDVTYRLDGIRETDAGRQAVIGSTYALAETAPTGWPIPYSGRFQMSGTFGFLGRYEVLQLEGTGREVFNIDAGRVERNQQAYTLKMRASLPPMGIRANPHLTIEQTLTMELLSP